jgi:hypothetical protein
LSYLNVTHHIKGLNKEEEWRKLEVSTMILRKVMAVQSKKFLKFINFVNNEKQTFVCLKKVENWWSKPTSNNHKVYVRS